VRLRLVAGAASCALAAVSPALGWVPEGEPWPASTIAVWNSTGYRLAVQDAMRSWNAVGANIRFVGAPSRSAAQVVVGYGPRGDEGEATVGYPGEGEPSAISLSRGLGRIAAAGLAAHELGHVLGLGHQPRSCSVMAPVLGVGSGSRCRIGACTTVWRCLVQRDDAAGALGLYGRRATG
jgi:hypothetical protein